MYLCAYSYPCALSIIVVKVKVMVKVTQQRIMGNMLTRPHIYIYMVKVK